MAASRAGPTGTDGWRSRKDRRDNATGDAEGSKGRPGGVGNQLTERRGATGRIGRRIGKGKGAEKTDVRVKERENIGPGNVGSRGRDGGGVVQDTSTELDGAGGGAGEPMPKEPPTARWIRERCVSGMFA